MKCEGADSRRAGCLHELAESDGGDFSVLFFSTQKFQTEIHEIYREEKNTRKFEAVVTPFA